MWIRNVELRRVRGQVGFIRGIALDLAILLMPIMALPVVAGTTIPAYDWTYAVGSSRDDLDGIGDWVTTVVVGTDGNVRVAGGFGHQFVELPSSVDFDPSAASDVRMIQGYHDVFVVTVSPRGEYLDAITFGGTGDDVAFELLSLDDGALLVTGSFADTVDFDPGSGEWLIASNGESDAFLCKFDVLGQHVWTRTFGGSGDDGGRGLALDADGNIFLAGKFEGSVDFDPGSELAESTSQGGRDVFIVKLTDGGDFMSLTTFGGLGDDDAFNIAVAEDGSLYVAGRFRSTVDFDPGPGTTELTSNGDDDAYLSRFDADGGFSWVWTVGSPDQDLATAVAVSPSGDPVVVGLFGPSAAPLDFDPTNGVDLFQTTESQEAFVTVLGADRSYGWARSTATNRYAYANKVQVHTTGIYVTGGTGGQTDFAPDDAANGLLQFRPLDAYLWHLGLDGSFHWALALGDSIPGGSNGNALVVDPFGNLLLGGFFYGACDFDPGLALARHQSVGGHDAFLTKLRSFFPTADYDGNGRVDLHDVAFLQICFGAPSPGSSCEPFDFNENTTIDLSDVAFVQQEITGP